MEATGAYRKPVYDVLEGRGGFRLAVGNAAHLKAVSGRKTDVKDAVWLARLPRHGPVRPSFIPDRERRELRELTRYRTALVRERAGEADRLQKTLEGTNIKLGAVLTDVTGASGQAILDAPVNGAEDPSTLADLAHWRVQKKREALEAAFAEAAWAAARCKDGYLPAHFRRLAARRGRKRAIVAVGHTILVIAYHLLARGTTYEDLGARHSERRDADRIRRRTVQRLESLGYTVTLEPRGEVACDHSRGSLRRIYGLTGLGPSKSRQLSCHSEAQRASHHALDHVDAGSTAQATVRALDGHKAQRPRSQPVSHDPRDLRSAAPLPDGPRRDPPAGPAIKIQRISPSRARHREIPRYASG